MFVIIATLLALDRVSKQAAERLLGFFNPALNWIQRWLPLFYVPTLVVLPAARPRHPRCVTAAVPHLRCCACALLVLSTCM